MCNAANLPVDYWPEYYKVVSYLLNHISTKRLNWKILFKIINNAKPDFSYMYVYGAKVYTLRNKVFYKDWLESYVYIGFLVDYNSRNIYCIWLFFFKHVMRTRDVIFIKDEFYKPDKLNLGLVKDIEEIIKYFEILLSRPVPEQEKLNSDKKELPYVYNQFYIVAG